MQRNLLRAGLLGLLVTLLGGLAGAFPALLRLEENVGLGTLFQLRGPRIPPREVVVVSLDKVSSDAFGLPNEPDKWPRSLHAQLVSRLTAGGAAVIGFDVLFDDPDDEADDARLGSALAEAGNVVLTAYLRKSALGASRDGQVLVTAERVEPPLPVLTDGALAVAPFPLPVVPVKVSQFWTYKASAGGVPTFPSALFQAWMLQPPATWYAGLHQSCPEVGSNLPHDAARVLAQRQVVLLLQAARRCLDGQPERAAALATTWQAAVPAGSPALRALLELYAGEDTRYLNYYGPPRTLTTVPYVDVLRGQAPDLRHRIVLVGFSEQFQPEQKDGFHSVYTDASGLDLSGVEIAATAIANMLDGTAVRPLPLLPQLLVIGFWGFLVGAACLLLPPLATVAFAVLAVPLYLAWAWWVFDSANVWLPVFVPLAVQLPLALLAGLLYQNRRTRQQRERVMQALGSYLPRPAVDRLMQNLGDLRPDAELLYGTCLATDAEQYTRLAESLSPDELGTLMNRYYDCMFAEVKRHGGVVTDVVGDSMMAIWAAATPDSAMRRQACQGALAVAAAVARFNATPGQPALPTRIGLHSGPIRLGTVGGAGHLEFRAVGDIVNTASRIEGLNKRLGTRLLVSGDTLAEVEGLPTRELGCFLLAGKSAPLVIHELVTAEAAADPRWPDHQRGFAAALAEFRAGHWSAAAAAFDALRAEWPEDGPVRFYAELAARYLANGADTFDKGAVRITEK